MYRDTKFLSIVGFLRKTEELSTCATKKVGCIIFDNDYNFISSGYNKSVAKKQCTDHFKKEDDKWFIKFNGDFYELKDNSAHKKWSMEHEVHAEIAALIAFNPSMCDYTNELNALISFSPCLDCCKSLIFAGVKRIYYLNDFDNCEDVKGLCEECGVTIEKVDLSSLTFGNAENTEL